MDKLPDDVLLHILSFLPARDLLGNVRAVNHTWRKLALHRDTWARVRVEAWGLADKPLLERVLRQAPRVKHLYVNIAQLTPDFIHLIGTTSCAVESLRLYAGPNNASQVVRILLNQVRNLRYLSLGVCCICPGEVNDIFRTISLLNLVELLFQLEFTTIMGHGYVTDPLNEYKYSRLHETSSLKRLFILDYLPEALLESIVSSHAESLEVVHLPAETSAGRAIAALAACPRLREAKVPALNEVAFLQDCINLTNLELLMSVAEAEYYSPALCSYLRNATQLRALCLLSNPVDGRLLLHAVASSGSSGLELLTIGILHNFDMCADLLAELPYVLAGLPNLKELHLRDIPTHSALEAIGPNIPPHLRRLDLGSSTCYLPRGTCCIPLVRRILANKPLLHISGLRMARCCDLRENCFCCQTHPPEMKGIEVSTIGFFEHDPQEPCTYCSEHTSVRWMCINSPSQKQSAEATARRNDNIGSLADIFPGYHPRRSAE